MSFPAVDLPLVGGHKKFPQTDGETLINMFAEKVGDRAILRLNPGYKLFATAPGSLGMRGIHAVGNSLFAVRGNSFSEWDGAQFVVRGTLGTQSKKIGIDDNQYQVMLVDELGGYGYNIGDTGSFAPATQFNDLNGGGSNIVFSSLRLFGFTPGTSDFWNSALFGDGGVFTWSGLNKYTKTSFSGPITALASIGQILFVFGEGGHEVFTYQGFPDTPMARVQSGSNIGISAPGSWAVYGQAVFWLGGGEGANIVFRSTGDNPERISDNQIEQLIAGLPGKADAVGYCYQERGHVFYVLSFMQGAKTYAYDTTTNIWQERVSRNPVTSQLGQHVGAYFTRWMGKNLIADYRSGNIYELSMDYKSDNGDLIYWERAFPQWPQEGNSLTRHTGLEVMMDMGNCGIDGRDTSLIIDFSDDKCKTWSMPFEENLGTQGEYGKRLVTYGLGSAITRNYRIRGTTDREITLRSVQVRV